MNTAIFHKDNWILFPLCLLLFSGLSSINANAQWDGTFTDYCIDVHITNNTTCEMTIFCDETADGQSIYNMGSIGPGQTKNIQPSQFGAHVYCTNNQSGQQVTGVYANDCGNLNYQVNDGCNNNPAPAISTNDECPNGNFDCSSINTNINNFMYLGEFNGHVYYKRTSGDVEYWTAQNHAESIGGSLPIISSQAENNFLVNAVNGKFWIGLTDAGSEGNFHWTDGSPVNYTNWNTGEPNNQGPNSSNADYVRVLENGYWADDSDNAAYWTVVEVVCPCVETPTPPLPAPPCLLNVSLGNDQTICTGETMELFAGVSGQPICDAPLQYSWSTGENTETITITQSGTYTVTATDCNGCSDTDQINITVLAPQGGTISSNQNSPITICADENTPIDVTLNNNSGSNAQWVITDAAGTIIDLPIGPPFTLNNADVNNCLIWHLSFEDGLFGASVGNNALTDLNGCYDLSNPIEVIKEICVEDIDLALTKTVNQSTVELGEEVVWTITITNQGPGPATGVTVTDALPQDLLVSNIVVSDGAFNPNNLTWTIGDLAINQSETLEVTTTVNAVGTITNTAQVASANELDVDSTPNNDDGDQSEDDEANASVTSTMPVVLASLGNFAFIDANQDGIQGANEVGLANVVVKLFNSTDLNNPIGQALTNNEGFYLFNDLNPSIDYVVQFMMAPDNYTLTIQSGEASQGNPDDSDAGTDGFTDVIDLDSGENDMTIDAGYFLPSTEPSGLGNFTFQDFNDNGMYDPELDLPLPEVTVLLYESTNLDAPISEMITDENGEYKFTDLDPSLDYVVQFSDVDGFQRSSTNSEASAGEDDKNDAGENGFTDVIDLEAGECDNTIDGGYSPVRSFIQMKVLLQGASALATEGKPGTEGMDFKTDEIDEEEIWLMNTDLFDNDLIPLEEPYTNLENYEHIGDLGGFEFIENPELLLVAAGPKGVVDWVFVELQPANSIGEVVATRAGLIQRDGTVIDVDGSTKIAFNVPYGEYFVAVRHRNHLGVMTAQPVAMGGTKVPLLDFTAPELETYGGEDVRVSLDVNTKALWGGDVNGDGRITFQGQFNDVTKVFFSVMEEEENTDSNVNYIKTGDYDNADCNMDNNTIYQGLNNEIDPIYFNVLTHPSNTDANANFVIEQEIP